MANKGLIDKEKISKLASGFFSKKSLLIIGFMYFVAISSSTALVAYNHEQLDNVDFAIAGIIGGSSPTRLNDNVRGFAWSSNIGWISFNSADCDTDGDGAFTGSPAGCPLSGTPFFDYGVNINTTGDFRRSDGTPSYAWSSNVGWIDFAPSGTSTPAHYDTVSGAVTGWAKILALGNDGWVRFSASSSATTAIDASGDFTGWAWNGNDNGSGIGWISFNCSDQSTCGTVDYKVTTNMAPAGPTIGAITEVPNSCKQVTVNWSDNSSSETGFEVEKSTDNFVSTSTFCSVGANVTSCTQSVLPSTAYYFRVRALGATPSAWSSSSFTTSYCPPALNPLLSTDYTCDHINLSWTQNGTGINHYEVWRNKDSSGYALLQDNIPAATLNYSDIDVESGATYQYYVKAQDADMDSNTIGPINPCPNLPTWRETQTQ